MKSISCTIWIVSALLLLAALDARPDPPAENPAFSACKVVHLQDCLCPAPARRCDAPGASSPQPAIFVAADAGDAWRPSDRMVRIGQAADTSPPMLCARRQSFLS